MDKRKTIFFLQKNKPKTIIQQDETLFKCLSLRKELLSETLEYETYVSNLLIKEFLVSNENFLNITKEDFYNWFLKENNWRSQDLALIFSKDPDIIRSIFGINLKYHKYHDGILFYEYLEGMSFGVKIKLIWKMKNSLIDFKKKPHIRETLSIINSLRNDLSHNSVNVFDMNFLLEKAIEKSFKVDANNKIIVWDESKKEIYKENVMKELDSLHNGESFLIRFEEKMENNKKLNK